MFRISVSYLFALDLFAVALFALTQYALSLFALALFAWLARLAFSVCSFTLLCAGLLVRRGRVPASLGVLLQGQAQAHGRGLDPTRS